MVQILNNVNVMIVLVLIVVFLILVLFNRWPERIRSRLFHSFFIHCRCPYSVQSSDPSADFSLAVLNALSKSRCISSLISLKDVSVQICICRDLLQFYLLKIRFKWNELLYSYQNEKHLPKQTQFRNEFQLDSNVSLNVCFYVSYLSE